MGPPRSYPGCPSLRRVRWAGWTIEVDRLLWSAFVALTVLALVARCVVEALETAQAAGWLP